MGNFLGGIHQAWQKCFTRMGLSNSLRYCLGGSLSAVVVVHMNIVEVMPPSKMDLLRQKFDDLEASRENRKFISQEINLHFTHR